MTDTEENIFLIREEPIRRLDRIVFALCEGAKRCGPDPAKQVQALRAGLAAQCSRCGARLSGTELLALLRMAGERDGEWLRRLQAGHCVRAACPSADYQLIFRSHPEIHWAKLFSLADTLRDDSTPAAPDEEADDANESPRHPRRALRLGLLLVAVLVLLWMRQCYFGGRIPFLREPEKFRVAPGEAH